MTPLLVHSSHSRSIQESKPGDQFGRGLNTHLAHDPGLVGVRYLLAEPQLDAHLLVGEVAYEQAGNKQFTVAEGFDQRGRVPGRRGAGTQIKGLGHQQAGDGGSGNDVPRVNLAYGAQDPGQRLILHQVAAGTAPQKAAGTDRLVADRQLGSQGSPEPSIRSHPAG